MSIETINRHRAKSGAWQREDSPWQQWPESMQLKTLVHELRKWVPWAVERQA
jgi:recombinational DNA repair protein RecT